MKRYNVGLLIGSLRQDSWNRRLAVGVTRLAPSEYVFNEIRLSDLPLYNQDDEGRRGEAVSRFKSEVRESDALLFVTPEYNRSVPGLLKNAIDHASRPRDENDWAGKPAGVMGASTGAIGTACCQQHLRNVLAYLGVITMGQPEAYIMVREGLFDDEGNIGPASREFLQGWMDRFVVWVDEHA